MSDPDHVDGDLGHLYPPFRALLERVLAEVGAATGEPWELYEGLRSQARQTWLYGIGRTHDKDRAPVTWKKTPTWHGTGLAGDVRPRRVAREGYGHIPHSHWETLRRIYTAHGLHNPAWVKGDYQHVQGPAEWLQKATAFVRGGFQGGGEEEDMETARIIVNGTDQSEVIAARVINGATFINLRDWAKFAGYPAPT